MSPEESLGERIAQARREKAARDRQDVRPVDLARALGVSQATVSDWEAGKITPREDALGKLAAYLGVSPAYLRYGVPVQPGPTNPTPADNAAFINGELAEARAEKARAEAAKAAGGTQRRNRKP